MNLNNIINPSIKSSLNIRCHLTEDEQINVVTNKYPPGLREIITENNYKYSDVRRFTVNIYPGNTITELSIKNTIMKKQLSENLTALKTELSKNIYKKDKKKVINIGNQIINKIYNLEKDIIFKLLEYNNLIELYPAFVEAFDNIRMFKERKKFAWILLKANNMYKEYLKKIKAYPFYKTWLSAKGSVISQITNITKDWLMDKCSTIEESHLIRDEFYFGYIEVWKTTTNSKKVIAVVIPNIQIKNYWRYRFTKVTPAMNKYFPKLWNGFAYKSNTYDKKWCLAYFNKEYTSKRGVAHAIEHCKETINLLFGPLRYIFLNGNIIVDSEGNIKSVPAIRKSYDLINIRLKHQLDEEYEEKQQAKRE